MSTHTLCFGQKIRKIGIPLQIPVFLYKCGVQGGILFMVILPPPMIQEKHFLVVEEM